MAYRRERTDTMLFLSFHSWADVLIHVKAHLPIYYWAPLDVRPRRIVIARVYKNGTLRIAKPAADVDAFTADAAHLERFKYLACDSVRYVGQPRFVNTKE